MKKTKLSQTIFVGVFFAVLGSGAFANEDDETGYNWRAHSESTTTRAQVREELKQSKASGQYERSQSEYYIPPKHADAEAKHVTPHPSRAEIRADAVRQPPGARQRKPGTDSDS